MKEIQNVFKSNCKFGVCFSAPKSRYDLIKKLNDKKVTILKKINSSLFNQLFMHRFLFSITLCVCMQFQASAQLKKSFFGKYSGTIGAYEMSLGKNDRIQVESSPVEIQLSPKEIVFIIGAKTYTGTWSLIQENKTTFVIEGKMDNLAVKERILIYKKGKKIVREGILPQPDVMLKKVKNH